MQSVYGLFCFPYFSSIFCFVLSAPSISSGTYAILFKLLNTLSLPSHIQSLLFIFRTDGERYIHLRLTHAVVKKPLAAGGMTWRYELISEIKMARDGHYRNQWPWTGGGVADRHWLDTFNAFGVKLESKSGRKSQGGFIWSVSFSPWSNLEGYR